MSQSAPIGATAPIITPSAPAASTIGGGYSNAGIQGSSGIATTYDSTPANGGFVDDLGQVVAATITNAAGRMTANATNRMNSLRQQLTSEDGYIDNPAKLQDINWQMSQLEMQMQQAAKLQEKEERMIQIWVRS